MTSFTTASVAIFRDRDLFVHDGRQLRRLRLSSNLQMLFAVALGLLVAFSTFSLVRFLSPSAAPTVISAVSDDMVRLASMTEQKVRILEQRQQLLASMLAGHDVDPAILRQIATTSAASELGQGGPLEPVGANSDSTFKQLFSSWKKLDNLQVGAIAVPSEKPVKMAAFTSGYGVRSDPFGAGIARHMGIDLAGPVGTPIYATADGIVSDAGFNNGGYGNLIKLNHGRGVETRYGHLSAILVSAGQHVTRGQLIARMGSTGRSTGSHLHYEVRIEGKAVNPIPFMKSTDYLLAMQKTGAGVSMDAHQVALGGPKTANR
jgi:murein DD-endopeptidase MepM/ murein hydrolase activator NlpD